MDLKISDLLGMQRELQDKYEAKWGGTPPERGALQLPHSKQPHRPARLGVPRCACVRLPQCDLQRA